MDASGRFAGIAVVIALSFAAGTLGPAPPNPTDAPIFQYLYPDDGAYLGGNMVAILWAVTHGGDPKLFLRIDYSIDSGATYPYLIAARYFPSGGSSWMWRVPFVSVTTIRVRVCATAPDGSRGCAASASDMRVITPTPYLALLSPSDGAVGVPLVEPVVLGVSGGIDVSTLSYTVTPATALVPSWSPDLRFLTLAPDPGWLPCTPYTLNVTVNDTAGSPVGPYGLRFTTECMPVVVETEPRDAATGRALDAAVILRFSGPMDPPTVTWTVSGGVTAAAAWSENDSLLTLTHATPFAACTTYTANVGGLDAGGRPLQAGPVPNPWTFTTVCTPPFVASTSPANGTANVNVSADITVAFSEPMNTSTVAWTMAPDTLFAATWNATSDAATLSPVARREKSVANVSLGMDPYTSGRYDAWLCEQRPPNAVAFDVPPGAISVDVRLTGNASDLDLGLWRDENGNGTCDFGIDTFIALSGGPTSSEQFALSNLTAGRYLAQIGPFSAQPGDVYDLDIVSRARTPLLECTAYTVAAASGRDLEDADLVPGPVPNPFSFTTACAVGLPRGLQLTKAPPGMVHLAWTPVAGADRYRVYESQDRFAPFPWGVLGETTSPSYDAPHLDDELTHFYIVRAVNGTAEGGNSSMGVKANLSFGFDPGTTNVAWFSLPYNSAYRKASDIVRELGSTKVNVVGKWDVAAQRSIVYYDARGGWKGTDFPIGPGDGLYVGTVSAFNWTVVGTDRFLPLPISRSFLPGRNVDWISMPFSSAYRTASEIVVAIEGSLDGPVSRIREVGTWDPRTQGVVSYAFTSGWMGEDFGIRAGDPLYLRVMVPFEWRLEIIVPDVP